MRNDRWMKRLMVLVVSGALMATLAATAVLAQQGEVRGPVTATGVLGEPYTQGQDPEPLYRLTDEATGTNYVLMSGFVDLDPYVGQRVTVWGAPVGGADFAPPTLNVTHIETVEGPGDEGRATDFEFTGTERSEVLFGTGPNDLIKGLGGHDYLNGMPGADVLYGGQGHDLLVGEAGSDAIYGGPGNDYLVAAYGYWQQAPNAPASPDRIQGGDGHDVIDSADLAGAPDTVICGPGYDVVYAGVEDNVTADCEVDYRYFGF